jgi:hypothetical protein
MAGIYAIGRVSSLLAPIVMEVAAKIEPSEYDFFTLLETAVCFGS